MLDVGAVLVPVPSNKDIIPVIILVPDVPDGIIQCFHTQIGIAEETFGYNNVCKLSNVGCFAGVVHTAGERGDICGS